MHRLLGVERDIFPETFEVISSRACPTRDRHPQRSSVRSLRPANGQRFDSVTSKVLPRFGMTVTAMRELAGIIRPTRSEDIDGAERRAAPDLVSAGIPVVRVAPSCVE